MMFPCEVQEQRSRHTLSVRLSTPVEELPAQSGRVYGAISQYLAELGEAHAGPAFTIYYNMDMQNMDVELGFPVERALPPQGELQPGELPGGTFVVCHYTGPYPDCGPAYEALTQFAKEQGYEPSGIAIEWYLNSPREVASPQELKTDIAFPVKRVADQVIA